MKNDSNFINVPSISSTSTVTGAVVTDGELPYRIVRVIHEIKYSQSSQLFIFGLWVTLIFLIIRTKK